MVAPDSLSTRDAGAVRIYKQFRFQKGIGVNTVDLRGPHPSDGFVNWVQRLQCLVLWATGWVAALGAAAMPDAATWVPGPAFIGMSEASAAAAIDGDRFVVACDEDVVLRVYSRSHPGWPVAVFDFGRWLGLHKSKDGVDLEGCARVGDRIYWIGSHSPGKDPRSLALRTCLFATDVKIAGERIELTQSGEPYRRLLEDLAAHPSLASLLDGALVAKGLKQRGRLEIEGLAAGPGGSLLVGFRGPTRHHRALVLAIENPDSMIRGERARLGPLLELDLAELGIRDLVRTEAGYWVVAGPSGDKGKFRLFSWRGPGFQPVPVTGVDFGDLHPEGLVAFPSDAGSRVLILSDDGRLDIGGAKGGFNRRFRTVWVRF